MPQVEALRDKVLVLCTFTAEGTQQALARDMDIKARDLSIMIHGSNDGDVKEHVPPQKLKKFVAFIRAHSNGRFSDAEATGVLLAAFPLFVALMFPLPVKRLNEILSADTQTLPVEATIVKRGQFAIVDAPYQIPEGAITITRREGVRFRIDAKIGRQLIVLYHYRPEGRWMRLAPGPWHPGPIVAAPTPFPNNPTQAITFSKPSLCYRFVLIEADLGATPHIGEADLVQTELDSTELAALAMLVGKLAGDQLRWQQVFLAPSQDERE